MQGRPVTRHLTVVEAIWLMAVICFSLSLLAPVFHRLEPPRPSYDFVAVPVPERVARLQPPAATQDTTQETQVAYLSWLSRGLHRVDRRTP